MMTATISLQPASSNDPGSAPPHNRCVPGGGEGVAGQRLATSFLVESCERALFDLRCSIGRAGTSEEVRVGLEAAALLGDVLATWRETLRQLRAAPGPSAFDRAFRGDD